MGNEPRVVWKTRISAVGGHATRTVKGVHVMFFRRKRNKRGYIWTVHTKVKTVDKNGRIYIPRRFRSPLNINPGDIVQINVDWESEVRIYGETPQTIQQIIQVHKQKVDAVGKLLLPKNVRRKYGMHLGTSVLVSLYEGYNMIGIRKIWG